MTQEEQETYFTNMSTRRHKLLNKKKMTAKDIWKKDEEKIKLAISSGFKIITIWESKFISNKESEIKKILKIL